MAKKVKSAVVIARLLGTEGFSDFVANQVEHYWRRRSGLTARQHRQIERLDQDMSRIMSEFSDGDRLVVGRFIGLHKKMSFDTGLKIGLQAFAQKCNKRIEEEDETGTKSKA